MSDSGSESAGAVAAPSSAELVDLRAFINYIRKSVGSLLELQSVESDAAKIDLRAFDLAFQNDANATESVRKFIAEPQTHTLLVSRWTMAREELDSESGEISATESDIDSERAQYSISNDVQFGSTKASSIAFIKRGIVIEADKSPGSQIRVILLSEGSPYETFHSYISTVVAPYFKSYIKETGKAGAGTGGEREGDKMAGAVEKKLTELEMGLLHLQQNIEIPEVVLTAHPLVQQIIKRAAGEGRRPKVDDFPREKIEDSSFLNQLQNGVNRWVREIMKVTKLDRDPASGTALQEISFWLHLERALLRIQEKRESPEITLTMDCLKQGKRFHAVVSFDTDTGLKQALDTVHDYAPLMKDFPINDLLAAVELDKIRSSIAAIFSHMRKIRNTRYPIKRALRLVEAISSDLQNQLLKVLGSQKLMHIPYEEFDKVMSGCFEVFQCWDDEYEKLQTLLRDLMKKKRDEQMKMVWRIAPVHKKLQARLDQMRKFRQRHEQLRTVIVRVLRPGMTGGGVDMGESMSQSMMHSAVQEPGAFDSADQNAIDDVNVAYDNVKEVDCLDLNPVGIEVWDAAMKRYEERIDRVEARITARLRDQLGTAKNANEMFRIFSRFNALFIRPHIRGAIREYQTQLIQRVKEDIEALHSQFKIQYIESKSDEMSGGRDLPPVSGSIVWAKQIDRQLTAYLRRVEDVLGKGWESHIDGQKLKADGDSFRAKLNTQPIFDDWAARVQSRNLGVSGRIFGVEQERRRKDGKPQLKLKVNFQLEIITLAKEVRNLKTLGFRVPLAIVNKAHQANQLYPFAISLIESVKSYQSVGERLEAKTNLHLLVAGMKKEVQAHISEGSGLVWESYKLEPFVQKFADCITNYQEKVEELLLVDEQLCLQLSSIDSCEYTATTFTEILQTIQKAVDSLSLQQYSNLPIWVQRLDEEIERKLAFRLQEALRAFTKAICGSKDNAEDMDTTDEPANRPGGNPLVQKLNHEMRIVQQVMYLCPSIEEARENLLNQLFQYEAVILAQERISHSRYQVGLEKESLTNQSYRGVLAKLPDGQSAIEEAYNGVENIMNSVKNYVGEWLRYQALWDLQPDMLYERLGDDLSKWMKTLVEIKKSRATFDTTETKQEFGPMIIDYAKVQSKVSLKYDSWHKEVLQKFGTFLGTNMSDFYTNIAKSRGDLEMQSVDASSTSEAVALITYVQGIKRKMKNWEEQVEMFKEGQRVLERQRFQFPQTWLHSDNVEGEWSAFSEILRRKDGAIQTQVSTLQSKIVQEDKLVENKTNDLLTEWDSAKPTGNMRPDQAAAALAAFEAKFAKVKTDRDNIIKAKEALELTEPGHVTGVDTHMEAALEEMADLRGVWNALKGVWEQVDEVKEKPWLSVQPRKLRQQIDGLLTQLKELPANYRNYDSFEYVKKMLQGYAKVNLMIVELKSEALKERHWKQLMKQLNVNWVLNDLTLGQVWDADLLKYDSAVREVMLVAQGEMALEEFMKQVREAWTNYELELISYQNKTKLIRGWDDLFTKLKEHINSVGAMKLSPYYKEFEEDAVAWDDKLNRINTLFDVWIDVQRRWVYLEGIFSGSADIKTLLPQETSKFQSICAEFLGLMKKVAASPRVMDVLSIPGVQKMLERLADLLQKIQKALGEYLERERSSFPRFYFVGDEDLLEIIGNTKNIPRLQKHFKKMFAGVTSILLNDDNNLVNGICSRENEEVKFIKPVSIKEYPKINDWLTQVEREMRSTLAQMLAQSMSDMQKFKKGSINPAEYMQWLDRYPAQIILLSVQISWSEDTDACLAKGGGKLLETEVLTGVKETLGMLADSVLQEQPIIRRKKLEQLIMEYVHKRDVTRELAKGNVDSNKSFAWLKHMRFYFDPNQADVLQQLSVQVANAKFNYGFEYLGVQDRLVQTPLTDRCYLTMTQALEARLGGSPFGPAGTGKTESVKMLGSQLGRFVLVFNCDEAFDFQAMGRIFVGLCQVGAWGCFDEFNRLEERMLSACSQQIQVIQECMGEIKLKGESPVIELIGKQLKVNPDMAIFITMNPGYAGRANLPDNLKQLFRSLAMTAPDRQLIAQVSLFSQGFRQAEKLASKAVPFFQLCLEQLSSQSHYDFGLRALKSVLASAGNVKRERIQQVKDEAIQRGEEVDEATIAKNLPEQEIVIQSLCETMVPKLVAEDIPLMFSLLSDVFPGVSYDRGEMKRLREEIRKVCEEQHLCYSDNEDELGYLWVEKVLQLYQITCLHHGLMMVGPSGAGKSTAWRTLLTALQRIDGIEGVSHVIDPKAMSKDHLYGWLDPNTREWTDGLFTHILRKIIDNVRGEINKRQWIIFDGDVDPGWVENLNSVLDESKLFTLPNGERLALPPNVRIMFEVENLKYATLATVSRCGMVWFSDDVVTNGMSMSNFIQRLRCIPLDELEAAQMPGIGKPKNASPTADAIDVAASPNMQVQNDAANLLERHFGVDGIVTKCLEFAEENCDHIMDFTNQRALGALYSMMNQAVRQIQNYNSTHLDFGLSADLCEKYLLKQLLVCCIWSFAGDGKLKWRADLSDFIRRSSTVAMPSQDEQALIDFEVSIEDGEWKPWINRVPQVEIETHKVAAPDVVIPTVDTVRHESMLYAWLADHKPMLLCGPPGSGKTMTLFSALRGLSDMEVVGLNFSSATTPELLLKTFDHYCEYRRTPNGLVLAPIQINKWLVLFCDEINLPDQDDYGTQRVISFLRQIVEQHGFYRTSDRQWVHMERIQFVGACNPPTDPGRKPLSHRFLRHVPVIYVDYPGEISLKQIYGTFNRAMLRIIPALRNYAEPLTNAMVELYLSSQERFTQDMQPHYVYSPRELTRWVRGICEAIRPLDALTVEGLVRLWAHEALRLFQDRLITDDERKWTDEQVDAVAERHFPGVDMVAAIGRPILYSCWLTKHYLPVEREELREYVKARLKVFYEEELDVPLVLFNEVLDHVLRIDRIFRQPQGHVLLIGVSGSGKTTLSRFVAWMNGFSVFQVKVHNRYTALDFDEDLRICLRRSGCRGEKIAFIMDESNVLDSSFLERMNTLLANGEVPGLFEGDEYTTLMTQVKEAALREGMMLDSTEELYKWFTEQVCRNLHVVFTMNPSSEGLKDKAATSPALFNRCVLNWTGDWSDGALFQVGHEFTTQLDLERTEYTAPDYFPYSCESVPRPPTYRDAILNAFVHVHQSLHKANAKLAKRNQRTAAITPRHYLDFIGHYVKLFHEKREELEEQQLHLNVGLQKIRDTQEQVLEMQKSLSVKEKELEAKNTAANAKLKQMLADQQQAEKEKAQGEKIQEQLKVQQAEMAVKKADVQKDLDEVEPAVQEAQEAVKGIQKSNLVEIRTMTSPPAPVRLAMESICLLLGDDTTDWKQIRAITAKDDFINRILNFDTDTITPQIRKKMKSVYINNEAYTYEKIQRASKACGPMVKWAIAQLSYSDMLNRVDPLRNELKELQTKAAENETKATETQKLISELEKSIGQYKDEYAELIGQAEVIKADLSTVKSKVDRSIELLRSLGGERERWEQTSEAFRSQMSTIVGDVLVSAAFLAYAGYFDQHMRQTLFNNWSHHLQACGIQYRQDMARVEYLSNPDERLRWQANELPSDDLCAENAIMLNRFNRYPLVIDPSGQAINFLMNEMKDKKLTRTSFLDSAFRKNLESALRFGNPLLVQDVESYDPILNPVLNREVKRTGGRVLITLGDQDIDLSPTFRIYLAARDPTVEFPADICSRVTFVNFTVTKSSLQSQCLNRVLKAERPDVDQKRSDLLKLQGEFALKIRHLEKSLLRVLNDSQGSILENDSVISALETLKKEAAEVSRKAAETDMIMNEVEQTSQQYMPLSTACASIYFTLEQLNQIHFLYQYSLQFFMDIFSTILHNNPHLEGVTDYKKRLQILTNDLFQTVYNRVSRGMLHEDRITFAILLARIYIRGVAEEGNYESEFNHLLRGGDSLTVVSEVPADYQLSGLSNEQAQALYRLCTSVKQFNGLVGRFKSFSGFTTWVNSGTPERSVPELCDDSDSKSTIGQAVDRLLVIQALRPDRFLSACHMFVDNVMGSDFMPNAEKVLDLGQVVENEVGCMNPILLCAVTGYDASGRIDDLAAELGKGLTSIAIGSAEGFNDADKAINSSVKSGRWVMLKNVHLAPSWLVQLEKKLHSVQPHASFRLFLTMEIHPKIPVNLLRAGRILVFEPPPGVKANLERTFSQISANRMGKAPAERARLYFILAWLHAIVQERLRYAPLGWSKKYEFSEADLRFSCDMLDTWLDNAAMNRANLPPDKIPFAAIQTLLSDCIYGGRIDNEFDQRLLSAFVNKLFSDASFVDGCTLVADLDGQGTKLAMPEGSRREQFVQWTEAIKQLQVPTWLGLPHNAEKVLLTDRGQEATKKLLQMSALDDDEELYEPTTPNADAKPSSDRPQWMQQLSLASRQWLKLLPRELKILKRTLENIRDPFYRFFEREVTLGKKILMDVRRDLEDVVLICQGSKKQTNHHRTLIEKLSKGILPDTWRRYTVPQGVTVIQWVADFSERVKQLQQISEVVVQQGAKGLKNIKVWLGGLFVPEAYVTATRQWIAQANEWALEELTLQVAFADAKGKLDLDDCSFGVTGLRLMGAKCVSGGGNMLELCDDIYTECPLTALSWRRNAAPPKNAVTLPVYLHPTRQNLLFTLDFETSGAGVTSNVFYERGVAVICTTALG